MTSPTLIVIARFSGPVPDGKVALECSHCKCLGLCRKCFLEEAWKDGSRILCHECSKPVLQREMLRRVVAVSYTADDAKSAEAFFSGIAQTLKGRN